ncbi:uncharacterized protein I303_104832 [Kwoniella dejecticola CBS 10117]|uniref:Phospholipid/glycerol acyltransferase domain-containing protein n=1 Tax=Kwoniella dejecticola CBS 10117 TaxID=1296121 RepID=A0A1A6A486_9TREE|nr:uncharacterized protein I303_04187 [Kwoniella dejecticola CBS 10117]OBR84866.1 hypothetical protein I303_04187 [Kwoniella dejecticola CBS 10117]
MEKYSKWRDPGTGIQPFLPVVPPKTVSPIFIALLGPFAVLTAIARILLLGIILLLHLILVEGVSLVFVPISPLYRIVSSAFTAFTCRAALASLGYWWITTDTYSPKRGKNGVSQIAKVQPKKGDLIITNWTSYVDVLYLAFRYNPTFVLPIFSPVFPDSQISKGKTGRHTGTGSAQINLGSNGPQPECIGYLPIPLLSLLLQTGALPPTELPPAGKYYKTLKEARKKENRPLVFFPEGTTSNGRALLKFPEGVLDESEFSGKGDDGLVWIKFIRHSPPTPFTSAAPCPIPLPFKHLLSFLYTPTPIPTRSMHIRTLHPSASPSSPSFLPSEVLNNAPGGLDASAAAKDPRSVWREAVSIVLAETGRVRRTKGMGWVEKGQFSEYWGKRNK